MKRRSWLFGVVWGLVAFLARPVPAQFSLFTWTLDVQNGGSGTLDGDTMKVFGANSNSSCAPAGSVVSFNTTTPVAGIVLVRLVTWFNYDDGGPGYDFPVIVLNGVTTRLPVGCFGCEITIPIPAGASFGFGVESLDCLFGAGHLTLDQFRFLAAPVQTSIAGTAAAAQFGTALASLGDIDGDGVFDFVVGAPKGPIGVPVSGRAQVHSGKTGVELAVVSGLTLADEFGAAVESAGDVDGDGRQDFLVGAPFGDGTVVDQGTVTLFSGLSYSPLYTLHGSSYGDRFGSALANAGDVDGDGIQDFCIGAPLQDAPATDTGAVRLVSGATGQLIRLIVGLAEGDRFGSAVDGIGDLDADGVPDVLIGAPLVDSGVNNVGAAYAYSGSTGLTIHAFSGVTANGNFGFSVVGFGDANLDGFDDLAIGAPYAIVQWLGQGAVVAHSGSSGAEMWTSKGQGSSGIIGYALAGVGDVDGDGMLDLAISHPHMGSSNAQQLGSVRCVSAESGTQVAVVAGQVKSEFFGHALAPAGDLDGDGRADIAIGVPRADASKGRVVLASPRMTWTDLDHALVGTNGEPRLEGLGTLIPNTQATLRLTHARGSAPAFLIGGVQSISMPWKGGTLIPSPDVLLGRFVTNAIGAIDFSARVPIGLPSGAETYWQCWISDPIAVMGAAASNGLRARSP